MAKPKVAKGHLEGDAVRVEAEAGQRLHQRHHVGTVERGALRLTLPEAILELRQERVQVEGHDHASLLAVAAERASDAEAVYLCYADLRDRGLIAVHRGGGFDVHARGGAPPAKPALRVLPVHERAKVTGSDVLSWCEGATVLGVVDEDGIVTYYEMAKVQPKGRVKLPRDVKIQGRMLVDRVVAVGEEAGRLAERSGFGTQHHESLFLSLTEAAYLQGQGILEMVVDVAAEGARRQHHFSRTHPVYEALREAGVVAKSGFRFGTHLRGYMARPGEGHADWMIQCVRPDDALHWSELSRAVRLAHGVRKSFLVAVGPAPVAFVSLSWFRP